MNTYSKTLLLLLLIFTTPIMNAQEVFFKDNNKKLVGLRPEYFYPMQVANILREYTYKDPSSNIQVISAYQVNTNDRFGADGEALGMNVINGYVKTPDAQFSEMVNNKVMNMSFWVRYSEEVYGAYGKHGILFSIREKATGKLKVYCELENGRIVLYVLRKKIDGTPTMVPIIKTDIYIDMVDGEKLYNYFFFCLTSENTANGKRTRIYINKTDGSLFSRLYYVDLFDGLSATNDMLALAGGWVGENNLPATGIDDLMFYQKQNYAHRALTPEEVLNNFYLQSPLYEGVSYEISGTGETEGVWGLESQINGNFPLTEEYITLGDSNKSHTPFGFNRFNVKKKQYAIQTFAFSSMKMGASFYPSFNNYIYMKKDIPTDEPFYKYVREFTPESRYSPHVSAFHLAHVTNNKYLQMYSSGGKDYLVSDYATTDPNKRKRMLFGITAATKVFRGPERNYSGTVQLINNTPGYTNRSIGFDPTTTNWDYVGMFYIYDYFVMNSNPLTSNYTRQYFRSARSNIYLRRFNGYDDIADDQYLTISHILDSHWEFLFYKYDKNGKPLYIMRTADDNVAFKMGTNGVGPYIKQYYNLGLTPDGEVPDNLLWSIHKTNPNVVSK